MRKITIFISVILLPVVAFAQDTTLTVTSDGNVGIGTDNPKARLQVNGGVRSEKGAPNAVDGSNVGYSFDEDGDTGLFAVGGNPGSKSNLAFFIDNRQRMTITVDGNVGIGTSTPQARLDVVGGLRVTSAVGIKLGLEGSGGGQLIIANGLNDNKIFLEGFSSDGTGSVDQFLITGRNAANLPRLHLGADETLVNGKLDVNGTVMVNGEIVHGSSREFKENISQIKLKEAMTALKALTPVKFNYKAAADDDLHLGFIAEDVPDLVATQDRKHLSTIDIVAVLTKVVQEQQTQIAKMQQEMNLLKNKIGE